MLHQLLLLTYPFHQQGSFRRALWAWISACLSAEWRRPSFWWLRKLGNTCRSPVHLKRHETTSKQHFPSNSRANCEKCSFAQVGNWVFTIIYCSITNLINYSRADQSLWFKLVNWFTCNLQSFAETEINRKWATINLSATKYATGALLTRSWLRKCLG